ncbi:MAG: hypothetical protein Harvfovirus15_6 [Harvfovirus sp.]|uniref:Tetratricopeptide repeat protein n=1 Tax=Harvfovirus sp. TaxID=2487768 RepID=A0A3G5A1J1_9VIRU|nr:MAG: hypothetical protein Harvfovirus15_6 [Harvfovirus sp.]
MIFEDLDAKVMYYLNHPDSLKNSEELLEECLEHEPKNKYYCLLIGLLLVRLQRRGSGVEWLEKAAMFDYSEAMYVLGLIYDEDGEKEKAKAWFSESAYLGYSPAMIKLAILNKDDRDFFRELMACAYSYAFSEKEQEDAVKVYADLIKFSYSQHEWDLILANREFHLKSKIKHLEQKNRLLEAREKLGERPRPLTFCERLGIRKSYVPVRKKFENFPHF